MRANGVQSPNLSRCKRLEARCCGETEGAQKIFEGRSYYGFNYRGEKALDQVYINIPGVFKSAPCPNFGYNDHMLQTAGKANLMYMFVINLLIIIVAVIKFEDDTIVVSLISNIDESHSREEIIALSATMNATFDEAKLLEIVVPLLLVEFILGSLFNAIALWIFCFQMKPSKPSIIYLFNLTLADFLLMCCLPFRMVYYMNRKNWTFGDGACNLLLFMVSLNRAGSIAFLTLVALDRYFKVVHPHHKLNALSLRCAIIGMILTWAVLIGITSNLLFESHTFDQKNLTYCESFNLYDPLNIGATWYDVFYVVEFLASLCVILYCTYSMISRLHNKKGKMRKKFNKAKRAVLAIVIVFTLSFLPSIIGRTVVLMLQSKTAEASKDYWAAVEGFYLVLCLTYANSMLDPIVYYYSSSKFQNIFLQKCSNKLKVKNSQNSPEILPSTANNLHVENNQK
ncbi:hydroxycarboxylic acid receptor 1-like [Narcine bancroftii]|uniref:hydroxycarboxylic acid receptor 1-like n=1 Tax=Narcine bancroftii TaxID=1343680 RepID=UPI0038313B93